MTDTNKALKQYAKQHKVELWRISERFEVTDATFSRRLRKEFNEKDSELFKKYVDEIAKEKKAAEEGV